MRKKLVVLVGLVVGIVLAVFWANRYAAALEVPTGGNLGLLAAGLLALPASVVLQVVRTGLLFGWRPAPALRRLSRPLVLAHGLNVLLPSMSGDLFEVWAVSRVLRTGVRDVLAVLVFRFAQTLAALAILMAVAMAAVWPMYAILVALSASAGAFVVDATWTKWTALLRIPGVAAVPLDRSRFGMAATAAHLLFAIAQHAVEGLGIYAISLGLNTPLTWTTSMGMLSVVDTVTYLPVPFAGVGLNHWAATFTTDIFGPAGAPPALLIAAYHAFQVLVGGLCCGIALVVLPRPPAANGVGEDATDTPQ